MRTTARWILMTVLVLDGIFALVYFSGSLSPTYAESATDQTGPPTATATTDAEGALPEELAARFAENPWSQKTLESLGREMAERAAALELRETDLAELERAAEVLARAGIDPTEEDEAGSDPAPPTDDALAAGATAAGTALSPAARAATSDAFLRLQKAYENMEPDSAAQALKGLAAKDKQAVVQLLLGWSPRVSGAILDALTQNDPKLAADLSYEIWKISGGK